MVYVTATEFEETFGQDLLVEITNLDTPSAETVDQAVFDRMEKRAAAKVDQILGARFVVPIAATPEETPEVIKDIMLDVMRYKAAHHGQEKDVRQRYEDACKALEKIRDGANTLGLPVAETPAPTSGSPACTSTNRVFSNDSLGSGQMGGFL